MAQEVKLHGGGAFDDATVTIDGHDVRIWHAAHRWGLDSNNEPGWWSECNDVLAGPVREPRGGNRQGRRDSAGDASGAGAGEQRVRARIRLPGPDYD